MDDRYKDETADINASRKFVRLLQENFTSNYNLEITELSTIMERLRNNSNHILIFYLHHRNDPFSLNFCFFLTNPKIEEAFQKNELVLYAWDISDGVQKDDLILSFIKNFDVHMVSYIVENKSVAFSIASHETEAVLFKVVHTPDELISLRDLLLEENDEKPITPFDFLRSMENLINFDEYTSYEREDHDELKLNIKYALFGPPNETKEEIEMKPVDEQKIIKKNMKQQEEAVNEMYNKILETNNMYCKWNGRVVIKMIYICAVTLPKEKVEKAKKFAKDKSYNAVSDFVPYPVFILRKCKHKCREINTCRIIIDTEGRVYESWNAFLENNRLPPCEIVYPKNGRYLPDNNTEYCTKLSPACNPLKKVAAATDVAAGVTGILAGGVSIAGSSAAVIGAIPFLAAAAPIALPVAAAVGIGSGLYAMGRSISSLVDRKTHKQDINLLNAESRAAYLNIAGGVMSVGMFGAMRTVSFLAGRGVQLGTGTRFLLYGLSGVNLTVGGMGIGNAIHQAIESKTKSPLIIAQLGASILFFAHSVYTFRNIGTVIEESQNRSLSEIEISLRSNRHRRTFNKLLKESIRTQGETQGKASVISSIRNMKSTDDVMAVLTRSNKVLHQEGIRFSAVGDQIMLNGRPVDMMNFGSMSKSTQAAFLETLPPMQENLTPNVRSVITAEVNVWVNGLEILGKFVLRRDINQLIDEILSAFEKITRDYILDITKRLFNKIDERLLQAFANITSNAFIKLMRWTCNQLMNNNIFQKVLNRGAATAHLSPHEIDTIVETLENDFYSSYTNYEYDRKQHAIRKEKRKLRNPIKEKTICVCCNGHYYLEKKNKKK